MVTTVRGRQITTNGPRGRRIHRGINRRAPFFCSRTVYQSQVISGSDAVSYGYGCRTFALSDVPSYGEFTNLFDQYKLAAVKVTFSLQRNPQNATTATNAGWFPNVIVAKDYNDSTFPTSINEMMQMRGVRTLRFNEDKQSYSMYLKPSRLQVAYQGVGTVGYGPVWKGFMATADYNVPHYAVKFGWEKLFAGMTIDIQTKYFFTFKDPK